MKLSFGLYVRKHRTGWYTAQVVTLPHYAAFGPRQSELREEIAEAIRRDVVQGRLRLRSSREHELTKAEARRIDLSIRAVQHERLVEVPMRFLVVLCPRGHDRFELHIPKLRLRHRIRGEKDALRWAEELIRSELHLDPLENLLELQYEATEEIETLELNASTAVEESEPRRWAHSAPDSPELDGPLAEVGVDLVAEAIGRRLGRPLGRDSQLRLLESILGGATGPAALLVGASGVGKSALVAGLAHRIAEGKVRPSLRGAPVWSIPGSRFMAGARFLGDWQARALEIIGAVVSAGGILDLGPLPEVLAASRQEAGLSLPEMLAGALEEEELRVIAEATPEALVEAERIAPRLVRRFQRIDVQPLPASVQRRVLSSAAGELGRRNGVTIGDEAVDAALDVAVRFRGPGCLPGGALALLESMAREDARDGRVGAEAAMAAFCKDSGYPRAVVDPSVRLDADQVRSFFEQRVLGQSAAHQRLANVVFLLKAGLTAPDRPVASILFAGPTGVGKTESALALTEFLFGDRRRMIRIDMSEFGFPAAGLRLVDGPDGEGALTRAVRGRPFSVVLLDEIEKADGSVLDLLLQVLGEGRLTDGRGRTVSFRQSIVIMTSNLGADEKAAVGFGGGERGSDRFVAAVRRAFRPELLNRIDHIVPFAPLERAVLERLAERMLRVALRREGLVRRGIELEVDPAVVAAVADAGFDPKYGARPMKRAVEAMVVAPLARVLADEASPGPWRGRLGWNGSTIELERSSPMD